MTTKKESRKNTHPILTREIKMSQDLLVKSKIFLVHCFFFFFNNKNEQLDSSQGREQR